MRRAWMLGVVLGMVSAGGGQARAWGLDGLSAVAVEVAAEAAPDPVGAEVELLRTLRELGVRPDPSARERLRLDLVPADGGWSAGLVLVQPMCLERDPLLCAEQATWMEVATDREADDPTPLAREVLDRFAAAWRQANLAGGD